MIKVKLLFLCGVFCLSGCTNNGLLFRSAGSYDKKDTGGIYKVGAPYQVKGIWYTPEEDYTYSVKGMASWYEADPDNPITENGELFSSDHMTARHRTLPLPSMVRITNLENGNTAIVRVNDRGPFVHNRLIDVSHKVAEALEFQENGTTMVHVEILPDESQSIKQQLVALGRVEVPTPKEDLKISDEVDVISADTPIYQPNESLNPLYQPVLMDKISDMPIAKEQTDSVMSENKKEIPAEISESQVESDLPPVLYNGGQPLPVENNQAPQKDVDSESDVMSDSLSSDSSTDALIETARQISKGAEKKELSQEANTQISELSESVLISKEVRNTPKAVDLTQAVNRPKEPVNFQEYFIQVGAFLKHENVQKTKENLAQISSVSTHEKNVNDKTLTIVRVGPFKTPEEARTMLDKIKKTGYSDARIVSQ